MPGASSLRDCKILENLVKKQAADNRIYAAMCASPAVALGSWDLPKGLKVGPDFSYVVNCDNYDNDKWI